MKPSLTIIVTTFFLLLTGQATATYDRFQSSELCLDWKKIEKQISQGSYNEALLVLRSALSTKDKETKKLIYEKMRDIYKKESNFEKSMKYAEAALGIQTKSVDRETAIYKAVRIAKEGFMKGFLPSSNKVSHPSHVNDLPHQLIVQQPVRTKLEEIGSSNKTDNEKIKSYREIIEKNCKRVEEYQKEGVFGKADIKAWVNISSFGQVNVNIRSLIPVQSLCLGYRKKSNLNYIILLFKDGGETVFQKKIEVDKMETYKKVHQLLNLLGNKDSFLQKYKEYSLRYKSLEFRISPSVAKRVTRFELAVAYPNEESCTIM